MTWGYTYAGTRLIAAQSRPTTAEAWRAVSYFRAAQRWSPADPALLRQLARAYLYAEDYDSARLALEQAYRLEPRGLILQRDLALAYALAGARQPADHMLLQMGMTPGRLLGLGDDQIEARRYADAHTWYRLAAVYDQGPSPELLTRQVISAALSGEPAGELRAAGLQAGLIEEVGAEGARLPGASLRWLTEIPQYNVGVGTPLNYPRGGETGVFWWTGEAVAVVDVLAADDYQIDLALCECAPPPIEMRVGVDGHPRASLSLGQGDGSISTHSLLVHLEPGLHTLHLWFDNNAVVDGVDRDARVEWIAIHPIRADS